jgi:hypothetical protein
VNIIIIIIIIITFIAEEEEGSMGRGVWGWENFVCSLYDTRSFGRHTMLK